MSKGTFKSYLNSSVFVNEKKVRASSCVDLNTWVYFEGCGIILVFLENKIISRLCSRRSCVITVYRGVYWPG